MPRASPCFNYFLPVKVLLPPNYFLLLLIFRINCKLCRSCYSPNEDLWDRCSSINGEAALSLLDTTCTTVSRGRNDALFSLCARIPVPHDLFCAGFLRRASATAWNTSWGGLNTRTRTHTHTGSSVISGLSQLWYPQIHIQGYCIIIYCMK